MTDDKLEQATELKRKIKTAKELQQKLYKSLTRVGGRATVKIEADVHDNETFFLEEVFVTPINCVLNELQSIWQAEFDRL